jgi:hypothetical protein
MDKSVLELTVLSLLAATCCVAAWSLQVENFPGLFAAVGLLTAMTAIWRGLMTQREGVLLLVARPQIDRSPRADPVASRKAHGSSPTIANQQMRRSVTSTGNSSGRGDGSHQRRGVDLIGHGGLRNVDDCEEQEFSVVEHPEASYLGGGKGEQHGLDDGDRSHEQHFGGIVYPWCGHFDLLRHRHDGGGNQQDFNPREPVSSDIEKRRSRIREDELPSNEQQQNVHEARDQTKNVMFMMVPSSVPVADDCGIHVSV